MAESVDRIEVQETNEGESADGCDNHNIHERKSDKQNVVSEFLTETSLHGLKYVGQSKRHFVERTFWIVAFIIGIAAAGYLIYGVFSRYEGTPVIVSFQSEEQSVDTIPFPAVTFCFSTLFSKNYVESLKRYRDGLHQGGQEYKGIMEMLSKIDSICLSRKSLLDVYVDSYVATINSRWDYYYIRNQTQYQQEIIDLLLEYTFSCKDLIPYVLLDGTPIEAVQIFDPVITKEYGKCCTFNMLPSPLMLKQPILIILGQLTMEMKGTYLATQYLEPTANGGGTRQLLMIGGNGVSIKVSYYPPIATKAGLY
ncbi:unnamed protein product [Orchesella dallaii]|uniref:Uncharacterized protein n=1 Tax=Orchesella dallaii TaxID=48710 RepID=A0ABP1R8B4_9HEXA